MSRTSNTEQRREQIVEGMIRVVAREGYERASVQEIARAAGLAPGLVHYHFRRKLDVLLAAQEVLVARHLARVARWMRLEALAGRRRSPFSMGDPRRLAKRMATPGPVRRVRARRRSSRSCAERTSWG